MVHGAAGSGAGRIFRRHPADDGRELFGAGYFRQQSILLGGNPMVSGNSWLRPFLERARTQSGIFRHHFGD
ncbi:hypothetical protein D3C78_1975100 [compost metagenome]